MLEKFRNDPGFRDRCVKAAALLIIIAVILLSFDVFTQGRDGRKQIIDEDGGTEAELCSILADIDGVSGVIVTAQGAGDPVVKNDLINAVTAVFNIPSTSVEVFVKKSVKSSGDAAGRSSGEKGETSNER